MLGEDIPEADGSSFPGFLIGGIEIRKRGSNDALTVNESVVRGATRTVVYTNGEIRASEIQPGTIFSRVPKKSRKR